MNYEMPVYEVDAPEHKDIRQLYIDIGEECNMSCSYCYNNKYNYPIYSKTAQEVEEVILKLREIGNPHHLSIMILGGEPTIHEELFNILDLTKKHKKIEFLVATNGLRLGTDQEYAKRLLTHINKHTLFILDWSFLSNEKTAEEYYKQKPNFKYEMVKRLREFGIKRNIINVILDYDTDKVKLKEFFDNIDQYSDVFSYITFNNKMGSKYGVNDFLYDLLEIGAIENLGEVFGANLLLHGAKFKECNGKNCCIKFKWRRKFVMKFAEFSMNSCWFRRYILPNNKLTEGINYLTIRNTDDLNITNFKEIKK